MNTAPSSPHADRDAFKRAAAEAAVQLVENDMVVGLGSGSTAAFAVEALARRQRQGLRFVGIPTSERTAAQAKAAGILLTSFSEHRQIDLTIDGADEVERGTLNLIKGLGGALLREKIVAAASHRLAIVVDGSKLVDRLGSHTPVPVEVVAFGLEATTESLEVLGASANMRSRRARPLSPTAGTAFSTATSAALPIRRDWTNASGASSA
jgi:ribose 5-phosphate isomerase A